MRKFTLLCLSCILLLSGCSNTKKDNKESMKNYESYIDAILTNQGVDTKIIPFDYNLNVYKQKNNAYQYEVEISNPRVAMYHVQAIAVDPKLDSNTNVYPCIGLLGEDATKAFNMIPYQGNAQTGFIRGFSLDGISTEKQFSLQVMVTWKDASLVKNNRVFFKVNYAEVVDDSQEGKKETADTSN
ncbi:MAG: hypothetical protein RR766_01110 [Longicatena sp.]